VPIKPFATNNNLLAYGLSSEPDPIGISPGVAMLNITVSNTTTQPIWCNRIQVQYPVGTDARDLTNDPGTIQVIVAPDTWRMIAKTDGLITFAPVNDQNAQITSEGLLFQLSAITVNDKVGTFTLGIGEHSHAGDGVYQPHNNQYLVSKFPYGWFMTDLAPRAALMEHGTPAVLDWQAATEGVFEIFYGSHGPVDVSSGPPFTSEPLEVDTVFILKGTIQVGGETVSHYLTTAAAVAHPALDASSLSVGGRSELQGGAEITGDAHITGTASVGSLSSAGAATVGGALTADSVRSNGSLQAQGPTSIKSSLTVDAQSTLAGLLVRGLLQATGRTSLFGQVRKVDPSTYKAVTDGLVIGAVWPAGPFPSPPHSVAYVAGQTAGYEVRATGGYFVSWIGGMSVWSAVGNANSFLMPVKAGDDWTVAAWQDPGPDRWPAPTGLWWLPIGGETVGATFEPVPPERRVELTPPPMGVLEQETAVSRLLDVLEEVTGTRLTDEQRARVLGPAASAEETGQDGPHSPPSDAGPT
jgi:hypothetical protein